MGSILKIFTLKNFWYFFLENFLYFLKRTLSLYSSKWNPALFSPSSKNKKIWQEKISYTSGNGDPQKLLVLCKKKTVLKFPEVTFRARKMKKPTLKKLLIVQEIKLFNPKLKKLLFFLKERFRLFHSWILLFFFGWFYCWFHFFTSPFRQMFLFTTNFTIVFWVFSCHQLSLSWLFSVRYFVFVLLYRDCYRFERAFFNLRRFLPDTPSRI